MIALIVLIVLLAILFGGGIGAGVHFLIWIALIALAIWVLLWFVGGVAGGPRGYWRRGGPPPP